MDASDVGVGAILNAPPLMVSYTLVPICSVVLSPAERNYGVGNRELLSHSYTGRVEALAGGSGASIRYLD